MSKKALFTKRRGKLGLFVVLPSPMEAETEPEVIMPDVDVVIFVLPVTQRTLLIDEFFLTLYYVCWK